MLGQPAAPVQPAADAASVPQVAQAAPADDEAVVGRAAEDDDDLEARSPVRSL
jgi:hypothetical protein